MTQTVGTRTGSRGGTGKAALAGVILFACLLSASLVAGFHIHLNEPFSLSGRADANYLEPLTAADAGYFVAMAALAAAIGWALVRRIPQGSDAVALAPLRVRWVAPLAAILFLAWLPYLLAYWPGLVFGDTVSSFKQLGGTLGWSNQHPVLYTLFIGFCLSVGKALGSITWGVALYSVIQMASMATCVSCAIVWARMRTGLPRIGAVLLMALYGLLPYFASYGVALWKDPLFSCAVLMLSLALADLALSGGSVAVGNRRLLVFTALMALVVVFFRNNGMYIVAACAACVFGMAFFARGETRAALAKVASVLAGFALAGLLAVSLLYPAIGVRMPSKESVSVPLNQMASVVAKGGQMDAVDREFLDALFPFDSARVYRPCLADYVKNNHDFNRRLLKEGILPQWARLGVKNPNLYLEAWVLQTFGFWSVNRPEAYWYNDNIMAGSPRNVSQKRQGQLASKFSIDAGNLLGSDTWREVFPLRSVQPPLGPIFWAMLFLCVGLFASGRKRWVLALVPTLALMLTLLLASPIWYWPRYGLSLQLAIPLYVGFFYLLFSRKARKRAA